MAFVNVDQIADSGYAGNYLRDSAVLPLLMGRDLQSLSATKSGYTGIFRAPAAPSGRTRTSQSSDITVDSITETSTSIALNTEIYKSYYLTSEEMAFSVDNFNAQVLRPLADSVIEEAENFLADKVVEGFARNMTGTAGTNPSTHAHVAAVEKALFDSKAISPMYVGLLNSSAYSSLQQLAVNISKDYRPDPEAPMNLMENRLGKINKIEFFRSTAISGSSETFDNGDTAGTVVLNGAATAGATTLAVDGFTAATGTVSRGTRFTIAGTATIYTVTADATIASNATTLSIYPALSANESDGDALTFETEFKKNVVYRKEAFQGAIIAPTVMGAESRIIQIAPNFSVALTIIPPGLSLRPAITMHTFIGAEVVAPDFGRILQGG